MEETMRSRINHIMYVKLFQKLIHKHYDTVSDKLTNDISRLIHCEAEMLVLMTGDDTQTISKAIENYLEAYQQHIRTEVWRRENENP